MYSEAFWMLFKDSWKNLKTSKSDSEVEHAIYQELKSNAYTDLRQTFISEGRDLPDFKIQNCPVLDRNLAIFAKNNAIKYDMKENSITVCKNYLMSDQHLKEELRREATLAFRYRTRESEYNL